MFRIIHQNEKGYYNVHTWYLITLFFEIFVHAWVWDCQFLIRLNSYQITAWLLYNFHIYDDVTLVLIQHQYFVGLRVGKVRNISIRKGKG